MSKPKVEHSCKWVFDKPPLSISRDTAEGSLRLSLFGITSDKLLSMSLGDLIEVRDRLTYVIDTHANDIREDEK